MWRVSYGIVDRHYRDLPGVAIVDDSKVRPLAEPLRREDAERVVVRPFAFRLALDAQLLHEFAPAGGKLGMAFPSFENELFTQRFLASRCSPVMSSVSSLAESDGSVITYFGGSLARAQIGCHVSGPAPKGISPAL